jgi:hypothetical protein
MAITSWGYFNEVTPGDQWSLTAAYATGSRFWVYNQDAVKVTPKIGGVREVNISAGEFGCYGIYNNSDAVATVQLGVPGSGTQWWLIVARHTWADALSATTFEALHCGSIAQLPAGMEVTPGDTVTQPLAYVPITVGDSDPGTPIDMRAMGTGKDDVLINSEFALAYLAYAGMRCRLGKTEYSRSLNAAGTGHEWVINKGPYGRDAITAASTSWGTSSSGWTTADLNSRMIREGNTVHLNLRIRRSGSTINVAADGGVVDQGMITTNAEWRPTNTIYTACSYISPGGGNYQGLAVWGDNGLISFTAGTPNIDLATQPAGSWSLSCTFTHVQTGA